MISTKLKMLERQLSKTIASVPTRVESSNFSDKALSAFRSAVEEETRAIIDAMEAQLHKAEAETAGLRKQNNDLQRELAQIQKDSHNRMCATDETYKQEMSQMRKEYTGGMQQKGSEITTLQRELADEQQARVRAETQKEAAEKMCTHLEQMLAKAQAVKPVAPVAAPTQAPVAPAPMKPVEFVVKRDELGKIVSAVIKPLS